jgi:hypothetical protein
MIKNPKTNRNLKIGSQQHRKAITDGILPMDSLYPVKTPQFELTPEQTNPATKDTKKEMTKRCVDIIGDNKKQFKKLNQEDSDELLKKMLYEKLFINKKKPKKNYVSSESESDE